MSFDCKLFFPIATEFTVMCAPQSYYMVSTVLTFRPYCQGFAHITAVNYNTNQRVLTFNQVIICEHVCFKILS